MDWDGGGREVLSGIDETVVLLKLVTSGIGRKPRKAQ